MCFCNRACAISCCQKLGPSFECACGVMSAAAASACNVYCHSKALTDCQNMLALLSCVLAAPSGPHLKVVIGLLSGQQSTTMNSKIAVRIIIVNETRSFHVAIVVVISFIFQV